MYLQIISEGLHACCCGSHSANNITKIFYFSGHFIYQFEESNKVQEVSPCLQVALYKCNLTTISMVVCFSFLYFLRHNFKWIISIFIVISASCVTISDLAVLPDRLNPNRDSFCCIIEFQGKILYHPREDKRKLWGSGGFWTVELDYLWFWLVWPSGIAYIITWHMC